MSQYPKNDPNDTPRESELHNSSDGGFNTSYGGFMPLPGPPDPGPPPYGQPPPLPGAPPTGYVNLYPPPMPPGSGNDPYAYDPYTPIPSWPAPAPASPTYPQQTSDPTLPEYPSQPGSGATPIPPPQPPLPGGPPRGSERQKKVIATVLALIVLLGGTLLAAGVAHHNQDVATENAHSTATAQVQARATATASAIASTYPFSNHLVLDDPLANEGHAIQYGWDNDGTNCFFANGTYHVVEHEPLTRLCQAHRTNFANFTYQIQMAIKQGGKSAMGGLVFRGKEGAYQNYILLLDAQGNYGLITLIGQSGSNNQLIESNSIPGFTPGLGHTHTLGIVANGTHISFYVDKQKITEVTNSRYTNGEIGVLSHFGSSTTEVVYNNAKVWAL